MAQAQTPAQCTRSSLNCSNWVRQETGAGSVLCGLTWPWHGRNPTATPLPVPESSRFAPSDPGRGSLWAVSRGAGPSWGCWYCRHCWGAWQRGCRVGWSVGRSVHPSIHLSIYLSVHLSVPPSIHPFICPSLLPPCKPITHPGPAGDQPGSPSPWPYDPSQVGIGLGYRTPTGIPCCHAVSGQSCISLLLSWPIMCSHCCWEGYINPEGVLLGLGVLSLPWG